MDGLVQLAVNQSLRSISLNKHGSVLVYNGQIFTGYNHVTDPKKYITIHSEEHAIKKFIEWCAARSCPVNRIRRKLNRSVLVTVRCKDDKIKYAPPCQTCLELIKKCGIKHIIYSEQDCVTHQTQLVAKKTRDVKALTLSSGYRVMKGIYQYKDQ